MSFKRAMTEEQKNERRQRILTEARRLFEKSDYDSVSVAEIAQQAGIAKGSVFLYFHTKEELFLSLTLQEYQQWNDEFDKYLIDFVNHDQAVGRSELLKIIDSTILNNEVLYKLLAMSTIIFEQNVSYEHALGYKQMMLKRIKYTGGLLDKSVVFFKEGDGERFCLYCYALILGLQQMSQPAPVIKKVILLPDFQLFQVDFRKYLLEMLENQLYAMENYKQ